VIKILTTSFGGKAKPSATCHNVLQHVKGLAEYDRDTLPSKLMDISHKFLPALILGMSAGICQRAIMNDSGMIRTWMGMHNRAEIGHGDCHGGDILICSFLGYDSSLVGGYRRFEYCIMLML
jgi:hypothetical protein